MRSDELEERLISYSVSVITLIKSLPKTKVGNHLAGQLVRSATSVSLNYGEARSGESRKDFIHKMTIVLKELRESYICLKIIRKSSFTKNGVGIEEVLTENNELISIFVKSVQTARSGLEPTS